MSSNIFSQIPKKSESVLVNGKTFIMKFMVKESLCFFYMVSLFLPNHGYLISKTLMKIT